MTCKECEQSMIIYDLLDDAESKQMEQHKNQCASCEKFWAETVQIKTVVRKIGKQIVDPVNPEALTDRIMTSVIRQRKPEKVESWFDRLALGGFARLALSGISICLAILFVVEIGQTTFVEKPKGPVAGLQVILSSQDFKKSFTLAKSEKRSFLNRCKGSDNKIDFACLKSKMKF